MSENNFQVINILVIQTRVTCGDDDMIKICVIIARTNLSQHVCNLLVESTPIRIKRDGCVNVVICETYDYVCCKQMYVYKYNIWNNWIYFHILIGQDLLVFLNNRCYFRVYLRTHEHDKVEKNNGFRTLLTFTYSCTIENLVVMCLRVHIVKQIVY